jgi:hypothetical protein
LYQPIIRVNSNSDGLLYYDGDSDAASLNPALNAAMLLQRFAPLASTTEKRLAYQVSLDDVIASLFLKTSRRHLRTVK